MDTQTDAKATNLSPAEQASLLITGATGTIGTELVNLLSRQGVVFRAMVRSAQDAETLSARPGVDAIIGDFDDPASLERALSGVKRAFLLTPSSERAEAQQLAFVDAARRAGVQHMVKLSQLAADADSPVRFLRYHAVVEQAIRDSGMAYTFLRPNLFMQGLLSFRQTIAEQGKLFAPIGDTPISLIDIRDIAGVAATAMTGPGHAGKIYTLTGPEALTHAQLAAQLSTSLGHSVTFVDIPPAVLRDELTKAGFPDWQADGLVEDYAHYKRGEASFVTQTVQEVTGQPSRHVADFAQDYRAAFS
ncbi:SDR family oxidoreductase [Spirosoma utsteinense]|uniref:NmrA-like domain-containing protein n=1 Tax=Spirosoma utsteinense TaxID=2585773 RepID=A0ABR6WDR4_9BACT|nr:SDR family oxidoreductase [Spirosoma utsteinense]MBC3788675.1 putative protein YbjT (DUF2867 family) [Spirosoma utsteinense]MBC3794633.1 putative protein YbjT (DUF2867 family) [Spirosoma utsteinense]